MFKKDPLQIIPFQTYGTTNRVYLRGRALEDETINLEKKGVFNLVINAWKRFESDEIRNTELTVKIGDDKILHTRTDDSGYFLVDETVENLMNYMNSEGWIHMQWSFKTKHLNRIIKLDNKFPGEMLVPSPKCKFGVISDIDDTILHTGLVSTLKWRVIYNTIFKSAGKRSPLDGAPEFYHLLHQGTSKDEANPMFYVSHSPWNLYRYLDYFLKKNNFPKGPIILRNFPTPFQKKIEGEKPQKQKEILNLLQTYPHLNFILIGDSGEHDPDIYKEIAQHYPDRISAIYLRSVKHKKKMLRVKALYKDYKNTPVLLVESSTQAITHAKKNGFIS
ncbi:App1 family protein [Hyunsoonleella sp. 2307UL5-6]|uniref:App1 family protein n=1 Tax=Hyunsoonleella sp. 2307UL5-6 TaxID=3384768 RepID=UPI0039BD56E3